jgi:hypothetical protein
MEKRREWTWKSILIRSKGETHVRETAPAIPEFIHIHRFICYSHSCYHLIWKKKKSGEGKYECVDWGIHFTSGEECFDCRKDTPTFGNSDVQMNVSEAGDMPLVDTNMAEEES